MWYAAVVIGIFIFLATSDEVMGPDLNSCMIALAVWLAIARAIFCALSSPG